MMAQQSVDLYPRNKLPHSRSQEDEIVFCRSALEGEMECLGNPARAPDSKPGVEGHTVYSMVNISATTAVGMKDLLVSKVFTLLPRMCINTLS